jgi:hypothetical protein
MKAIARSRHSLLASEQAIERAAMPQLVAASGVTGPVVDDALIR